MKKVISLYCLLFGLFIIACQKDGEDEDDGPSERMVLITSAAWKFDTAVVEIFGGLQPLPPGMLANCDKDNLITLFQDSTGTIDEGPTKCDVGDPQTTPMTWEFKNNETVINIPDTLYGRISGDAEIKELTATKLKLRKAVDITDPIPMTVNVVIDLKH